MARLYNMLETNADEALSSKQSTKKYTFLQKCFSVKNNYYNNIRHKVIHILGIKFSIKVSKDKKQRLIDKIKFLKLQRRFTKIESKLKNKDIINITFMVSLSSMFPAQSFLDYLLTKQNPRYKVKILIVPNFKFGIENAYKLQEECYNELSKQYGDEIIIKSPINEKEDNLDIKSFTDILFCPLPYDISHPKYSLDRLIKSGILPAIVNYGYFRSKYDRILISSPTYSKFWKIFIENKQNLAEYEQFQIINSKNCVLTGYCKMDRYDSIRKCTPQKDRKTMMIAPHHSVSGGYNDVLSLSNFYQYAEFFLELPKRYPDIDWIFRPHPALFLCLQQDKFWGKEKVEKYMNKMKSIKNVRYSDGGDYLSDFAESDALIQDCGSFLVDYFYTNKPQCYMLKDKQEITDVFSEFGQSCLDNVYQAFNQDEIINFIDNVVINKNDYMKEQRETFAKENVTINFPNVSEKICQYFNEIFGEIK